MSTNLYDSCFREVGEIVYNKLDKIESIVQDMFLAYCKQDTHPYHMTNGEWSSKLKEAEDLLTDLMKINKDIHYKEENYEKI